MSILGLRCRDYYGQVFVVVDRKQAKQTKGFWISKTTIPQSGFGHWDMTVKPPEELNLGFSRYYCLCPEEELDEVENEFGLICP